MASTRLYFTASVEEEWRALAGPWLRERSGTAWKNLKPTVILTPSRAESFYLRNRLVMEGIPFLGLRFWTPSDARQFLLSEMETGIGAATQAELRLIARSCAEKLIREGGTENATLNSVVREPAAFLRAYDLLLGAGWNPAQEGAVYGRDLAREMQIVLEEFQVATQAGLHRHLRRKISSQHEPLIANLLVVGFNAAHWPLWDLLKAVVFSAEQTVVALSEPRVFAEEIDQLWVSSWEEVAQTEALVPIDPVETLSPEESKTPFAALVASYEKGDLATGDLAGLTFCVTPDLSSQIRAIVLRALDYLRVESCTRLGIVFAEANALALGVAEELRRLGIPMNDGTGSLTPGIFERRCWQTWISLQEEPGVSSLIAWVRACEAQDISSGLEKTVSARDVANVLENALGESLVDDLNFLARQLEEKAGDRRSVAVADFLRHRVALPESALFSEFLALTREALTLPGWEDYLGRLRVDPPAWLRNNGSVLSRRSFLEWLKESTESQVRTRGAEGNHFYGRVHLVIYAQMTGQTWSHLILTGLNEGVWPRVFETGAFGSRHELALLNQQARELNQLGSGQGGQGMGHKIVCADRGHCLLPLERQELALRDLCAALESTAIEACLTAMTAEAGRGLLPSDFFTHAYQSKTGRVLDEETFRNLANSTQHVCSRHKFLLDPPHAPAPAIAATRIAYAARRDYSQPFGPYEFSYAQPPVEPIQLSCKEWEDAWNHPASAWLEKIVGASPWPEGTLSWSRAVGTWVHRWLAASLRECRERNSAQDFLPLLIEAADREALGLQNRARAVGIDLYSWWEQVWAQARSVALGLGETIAPHLQEQQFLSEFRLPDDIKITLPGTESADFLLKGRIDLLLVKPGALPHDLARGDFSGCDCWVIDFKTGSAPILNEKRIAEGKGLQALLYALAVQAKGATATAISLQTRDTPLQPQVRLDDVLKIGPLFRSLDKFHRAGVFGRRPEPESAYGYSPSYPIATRFVPKAILETKWAFEHGTVPAEEME